MDAAHPTKIIICPGCKEQKQYGDFYTHNSRSTGRGAFCKSCIKKKGAARYQANKDKMREYNKQWREKNRDSIREAKKAWCEANIDHIRAKKKRDYWANKELSWEKGLKFKYGITAEDYHTMFAAQNGCCKICKSTDTKNSRSNKLAVDHCHRSGKVRGLLCHNCNSGIGHLQDDPEIVLAAVAYLREA